MSKILITLLLIILITSSNEILYKFAKYSAITSIYLGSLEYFLKGSGVKYGQSVSNKILSFGK